MPQYNRTYLGFILKYIQASIADMAFVEGIQECFFINQSTSGSVYDAGPCGHGGQLRGTYQCMFQAWDMEAEVVLDTDALTPLECVATVLEAARMEVDA